MAETTINLPTINGTVVTEVIVKEYPIEKEELKIWGPILLSYFSVFIISNSVFVWITYKNWDRLRESYYFYSNLLCLFLTIADLTVAIFIGFPTAIRLTWIEYFSTLPSMQTYLFILLIVFEYTFLLRIVIITVFSVDKCLHIVWPLKYTFSIMSDTRACLISLAIITTPVFVRVVPNIVYAFNIKAPPYIICLSYIDNEVPPIERINYNMNFSIPLTCAINTGDKYEGPAIYVFELAVQAIITLSAFVIIISVDVTIFISLLRNNFAGDENAAKRKRASLRYLSMRTLLVTCAFTITNFPYLYFWLNDYLNKIEKINISPITDRKKFQIILLTFLSLIFHPLLYSIKMSSLKNLFPGLKRTVTQSTFLSSIKTIKQTILKDQVIVNHAAPTELIGLDKHMPNTPALPIVPSKKEMDV